jgi:ligand-binding sensor domain-containing protein
MQRRLIVLAFMPAFTLSVLACAGRNAGVPFEGAPVPTPTELAGMSIASDSASPSTSPLTANRSGSGITSTDAVDLPTLAIDRLEAFVDSDDLTSVAVDPKAGEVWTTSVSGGVTRWSGSGKALAQFTVADGLPSNAANDIAFAPDGTVWVATDLGAGRRSPDGVWTTVRPPLPSDFPITVDQGDGDIRTERVGNALIKVAVDTQGGVWFGAVMGVARLGPDGDWEQPPWGIDKVNKVGCIRPAPNGDVWIGTLYDGLQVRRADGQWQSWETIGRQSTPRVWDVGIRPDGRVLALHGSVEPVGSLWRPEMSILTEDGQWVSVELGAVAMEPNGEAAYLALDGQGQPWIGWQYGVMTVPDADAPGGARVEGQAEGLQVYTIYGLTDIALDGDGTAWLATDVGLYERTPDGRYSRFQAAAIGDAGGSVVAASPAGVFLGGGDGIVERRAAGSLAPFDPSDTYDLSIVDDIAIGADGAVWVATGGGVVGRMKSGALPLRMSVAEDDPRGRVTALAIDADGSVWWLAPYTQVQIVCTTADDPFFRCFGPADGLPANTPSAIAAGSDGSVWVGFYGDDDAGGGGATQELARYAPGDGWRTIELPAGAGAGSAFALAVEGDGALWVRTAAGLSRRDKAGAWTTPEEDPSLAAPFIDLETEDPSRALAVGPDGSLWVGDLPDGLRVRLPDGSWRALRSGDGLAATHITDFAFGPDGSIWLGTAHNGPRVLVRSR